jgi:hypothetical protein
MLMNGVEPSDLGMSSVRHGRFVITCLLLVLVSVPCIDGMAQTDRVAERNLGAFFEVYLARKLSGTELREVTREFIRIHTARGENRAGIHRIAQIFGSYVEILRDQKGSPLEVTLRRSLILANYFESYLQNTTSLRLFLEPDPVRVVDPGSKRLMTQSDVLAFANLVNFSNSNGDPRHMELSRRDIDRIVAMLDRLVGDHPNAEQMPRYFFEAGVLWAGIRQYWPQLNAGERRQARTYAGKGHMAPMDSKMYSKLLALDSNAAFSHWTEDNTNARLRLMGKEMELRALQTAILGIRW